MPASGNSPATEDSGSPGGQEPRQITCDRPPSEKTDTHKGIRFYLANRSSDAPALLYIQPHDIVVHIISVTDREIAFAQFAHPHPLVKVQRPVVAVDVQLHAARRRMHRTDIFHGMAEQEFPGADSLEAGKDIDFLQMERSSASCCTEGNRTVRRRPGDEPGELPHISRASTSAPYIHSIIYSICDGVMIPR